MQILAAIRTPFTSMGASLASQAAADLGRDAATVLLAQTGIDPEELSEVIIGCVCQPVDSANIARVIALRSGVPKNVPAVTVNRNCASGMEAITTAAERIAAGRGDLYLVGGVDSMSNVPLLYRPTAVQKFVHLAKARRVGQKLRALLGFRPADFSPLIGLQLGLTDPYSGLNMGETAEVLARDYRITREQQDAYAVKSQKKAAASRDFFDEEIATVYLGGKSISADDGIREGSSIEKLAKLRPVFNRKTGSVTAGNASQITDGAVMLLVATEQKADDLATRYGLEPLGRLTGYAYTGCDPRSMGIGPVQAIARANQLTGLSLDDADTIEINEAFAAQVLACCKALSDPSYCQLAGLDTPLGEIPMGKLNPHGGAIALGHPVGATGARLVLTALHELANTGKKRALTSLCIGGGQGAALWLETS
ncbi:MAG: thiolase family protein [Verrucomicrobiae bacterium]|nr:thiolase family protein [Verrucomicrobiae bacterium]NNJ42022.1 thiolase family protein [Akkermansiaceae bacterium]